MKQISFFSPLTEIYFGAVGEVVTQSLSRTSVSEAVDMARQDSFSSGTLWLLEDGWGYEHTWNFYWMQCLCTDKFFLRGLKAFYGHYLTYPPQSPGRWREGRGSQQYRVGHQSETHKACFKRYQWASLVVQWLRICLPTKGTPVWSLVQQDPTCHQAPKPMHCS